MAVIKKNFINNKINKDVDRRLIGQDEYVHAQNISIPAGDETGVGSAEIILGNELNYPTTVVSDLSLNSSTEVIGYILDEKKNRIYWFVTDYSGFPRGEAGNVGLKQSVEVPLLPAES